MDLMLREGRTKFEYHSAEEELEPFAFKDDRAAQEEEDRKVRAMLRQVNFPDML